MIPVNSFRHQHARMRVALVALVLMGIVAALAFSSRDVLSQGESQRRDLDRVFRQHDRLSLDPGQVARQVKQTRSLTLTTSRGTFEMTLEPYDIRTPGYVAEAWGDNGSVRVLERAPVRTYKGTVQGLPGAQARMTIDEGTVEGLIVTPRELFFLEPSKRFSGSAAKTDFVFYAASDVKQSAGECGMTMKEQVEQHSANVSSQSKATGPKPEAVFGPALQIDIATEADFEYFSKNEFQVAPNPQTAVIDKIVSIMNQVDGIYNVQMGLKFLVMHTRVWTTVNDPYQSPVPPATTIDASAALNDFRLQYAANAPPQAAGRDAAHLFMGRDFIGSTIGIAYLGSLDCSSSAFAYGISQHLEGVNANLAGLTAHEIGHNLNANHVNSAQGSDCTSSIMNPNISPSQNFCQFSRDEITDHAIAESGCLTSLTQPGCTYSLSQTTQNPPAGGGSNSVDITTQPGCNWAVAEGESWLTVTGGSSGTGSGTVTYSVTSNSICGARSGQVSIGGQLLTVNQAGNPNFLLDPATATPISPFQAVSGDLSSPDCPTGLAGRANAFMDRYKFTGMAGQKVRIDMNATAPQPNGLDTYLYLFGPDGSLVDENDDIVLGSQTDSRIPCPNDGCGPNFRTLTQTGTYIIVATSFGSGDTGGYTLTLTSEPLLLTAQVTDTVGTGAALNSVTFARTSNATNTAFSITDPYNFSSDDITRLILFTSDLGLISQQNPDPSVVTVRAGGTELVVENVGPFSFPGLSGSYVVVALKRRDGQPMLTGSLAFTVTAANGTLTSNAVTLTIAP
ncbi:MAG TPA: M12 family metallo-peptidase [Pyrinomonadaceae bacterium]|nr:M12 family metallo-peptidase [Pyrinomonadaceae bacterium]